MDIQSALYGENGWIASGLLCNKAVHFNFTSGEASWLSLSQESLSTCQLSLLNEKHKGIDVRNMTNKFTTTQSNHTLFRKHCTPVNYLVNLQYNLPQVNVTLS